VPLGAVRATAARGVLGALTVLVLALTVVVAGPLPKAFAAAGEETVWIGPLTGGQWMDAANWSNGVPTTGAVVVFDTPAQVNATKQGGDRAFVLEFRAGSSGVRLDGPSEYRIAGIVVAEGVEATVGLRLLRSGGGSTLDVAMSDDSVLTFTRQVQTGNDVHVRSTKLGQDGAQADLRNAVIRIATAEWETASFHLSGGVRLELDKEIGVPVNGGTSHPINAPVASAAETASPTAGTIVWLRDEQLFPDAELVLARGLSAQLDGRTQTLAGLTLENGTARLGDGGRLVVNGPIHVRGDAQSLIADGTLDLGSAPRTIDVGGSSVQIRSALAGTGGLEIALDGGLLALDDACGYEGALRLTGTGTVTASNGVGGPVTADPGITFIDGSAGACGASDPGGPAVVPLTPPRNTAVAALEHAIGAAVSWEMPSPYPSDPVTGFELYRSTDPESLGELIALLGPSGNTFRYEDAFGAAVPPGTTVHYRVVALSATARSEPSAPVAFTVPGPPNAPRSLETLNGRGQVKLSWPASTSAGVDGYRVYREARYSYPTVDDPEAGSTRLAWGTPFGSAAEPQPNWTLIAEVPATQLDFLDDLTDPANVTPDPADVVPSPAFPLDRTWNYVVTAYSDLLGESTPVAVAAGTPSSVIELTMSIRQETEAYPGSSAVFTAEVANAGTGPTTAGKPLTARLLVPAAFEPRGIDPATQEWAVLGDATPVDGDGDGAADWTCSASTIGDGTTVRCDYASTLAAMSWSTPLPFALGIPEEAALGTVPISFSVAGYNATGELGIGSHKPFAFQVEARDRAALEVTTAFDGRLSADPAAPSLLGITVSNVGAAPTTVPPLVTLDVPPDAWLGDAETSPWICAQAEPGADIECALDSEELLGGVLLAGVSAPQLLVPIGATATPWHRGAAEVRHIDVRASAPDAYGPVESASRVAAQTELGAPPSLHVEILPRDPGLVAAATSAFRVSATNLGGASLERPVSFVLGLPGGVLLDLAAVSSAWSCEQTGTEARCTSRSPISLEHGQIISGPLLRTQPLPDGLVDAGRWPLTAHATQDGVVGTAVDAIVEIAPRPAPAVSKLSIQPAESPLRSSQSSSLHVTLTGDADAGPADARSFAALLPSHVTATSVAVELDGFGPMTVAEWGDCSIRTTARGDAVVCVTDAPVPRGASASVVIEFEAGREITGVLEFAAGYVDAPDPIGAIEASGAAALAEPVAAVVEGVAFVADAGPAQEVTATVVAQDGAGEAEIRPTTVRLAGSVEGALEAPVAYCWVQTGGPAVEWVPPSDDVGAVVPGAGGIPAFPSSAEVPDRCAPGGFDADTAHWFGAGASFLAPATRDGAELTFRLVATDGAAVATAATAVTVAAAGNTPPAIDSLRILREVDGAWVEVEDPAVAPTAGETLRIEATLSDPDGDAVTITPWLISPRSAGVVFAEVESARADATTTVRTLAFAWPSSVAALDLGFTARDGFVSAGGVESTASASLTIGAVASAPPTPPVPEPGDHPIDHEWRVAEGLDLEGWVASRPVIPGAAPEVGTVIVNEDARWRPGPLTLEDIVLTVLADAPPSCTAADGLAPGAPVLGLTAAASIDWDGRDTKERDFELAVEGCIVPGSGWNLVNADPIERLDISDVPKTLTFRGVSFLASAGPGFEDPDEDYQFVGTAQSNGADGPARMHVWVPDADEVGIGATTFVVSIEARMADLSLYYGGDGYLLYSPTGLPSLSDIPGFDLSAVGASRNADGCAESTERHEDIPIPAGFSAVTNYQLDHDFCFALNSMFRIPVPGTMPMVTPITAVPKGTIYLSSGEYELFHEPHSGARASMTGLRLVYSPTIVQLISDGSLTLPDLVDVVSGGRLDPPTEPTPMDVSIGITFGTNFVKEISGSAFIQRTGAPWRDAFHIPGLDIGDLTLQAGFRAGREAWLDLSSPMKVIPEYAANLEIVGLPESIETLFGITGGEPIRAAGVITTSRPDTIWDFQLGVKDGHDFIKLLHVVDEGTGIEELITADVARLVIAPLGGTIGDKIYPWGVTAELWVEVLGLKLGLDLNVDLLGLRLDGEADLGRMTYAGMGVGHTDVEFVLDGLDPTAYFAFDSPELLFDGKQAGTFFARLGFGGDDGSEEPSPGGSEPMAVATASLASLGPDAPMPSAGVAGTAPRTASGDATVALDIDVALDDIAIPGIAALDEARIWAHREFGLDADLREPVVGLDMGMSASIDVLGQDLAVIGTVDLDQSGLRRFDLVGAAGSFELHGTRIGGEGCGDVTGILPDGASPAGFPEDGPCVRVALRPGAPNPYLVGMTGSITVPDVGLEATFDGRVDGAGLAIDRARLRLTSDLEVELTDSRLFFGPTVAAGLVTDTDRDGRPVTVENGDFRLRGSAQAQLLGFGAKLRVDVGKIGAAAWADGLAEFDALKGTGSPLQTDARLAGTFAKHGGDYEWSLEGSGAVTIRGYRLTGADFSIGERAGAAWFTLEGQLKAGPITTTLAGDLAWNAGLELRLAGQARLDLGIGSADAEVRFEAGQREIIEVLGHECLVSLGGKCLKKVAVTRVVGMEPFVDASLRFSGQALGLVRLKGSATFAANGDFTASGEAKVIGFTVDVDIAVTGGKPAATFEVEVWDGLRLAGVIIDSNRFGALASVKLPNLKVNVKASKAGWGLDGYLRIDDATLDVGFATADGVWLPPKPCAESEKIDFFGSKLCPDAFGTIIEKQGLYVKTAAKIEIGGCVKGFGKKKCDDWDRSIDLKLNPIKLCADKSFKLLAKFEIEGCYEPPTKFTGKARVRF